MTPFLFGTSERMKELERRIQFIARSGLPVLIEGACGTGKDTLAELLHQSSRVEGGLLRILCRQAGMVIQPPAGGGTIGNDLNQIYQSWRGSLFLKNVHLLTAQAQEQLLATLEQAAETPADETSARLLSSTGEALEPLVAQGGFAAGLYYRLSVYRVTLPALRERASDIPELFAQMVRRAANGSGAPPVSKRLTETLMAYNWPGNLRELYNVARTYVVAGDDREIIAELSHRQPEPQTVVPGESGKRSLKEQVKGASQKLESEIILRTLERHRWNRRRAAESLQISYRSLLYKMKNCNLRATPQSATEGE